jgi:hypothetical protein
MMIKSVSSGAGMSEAGPVMQLGSPVPFYMRDPEFLEARVMSTTFWELL